MPRLVVALVVALALGCASRPTATCPVAPVTAPGAPLLWKVQRADGPRVWLYGTIHDAGIDAVPRAARDALATSTRFASELGDLDPDKDVVRERIRIRRGPGLDFLLPATEWWDLRDLLRDVIREDDLRRVRPWYAMILLNRRSAPKVDAMDAELAKAARARELPVEALETVEAQLDALDAAVTIDDLREALRTRVARRCEYTALRAAYDAGDVAALEPMLVIPRTAEVMLYARNRAWLPVVERYLGSGGAFVAVGLGHLLGEQGLLALLARAGYRVERAR